MSTATVSTCAHCGSAVTTADRFCEGCGAALGPAGHASSDRVVTDLGAIAAVSQRGVLHAGNEDAYFVGHDGGRVVAVVCDGVSSSTAGAVAARVGAEVAGGALRHGADVEDAIAAARHAVAEIAWSPGRDATAPSATIVAATVAHGVVTVAGLGDSRAYWIDPQDVRRLTRDDSWVEEQLAGGADPSTARSDPRAHVITAWLGADAPEVAPAVTSFRPVRRGLLLLCSDGLWNPWLDAEELAALVRDGHTGAVIDLVHGLVDRAAAAGSRDDITLVVADVVPTSSRRIA